MKYRKKPVIIEAFQMTKSRMHDRSEWPGWLDIAWHKPITDIGSLFILDNTFALRTLIGLYPVFIDDWIIKGVKDELYACKPDIFEMTYEKVED